MSLSPPARPTTIVVDPAYAVGTIDQRTRGGLMEHMGRCIYEGIYEPAHPLADGDGFRTDVRDLVRELGVTTVRYPGGNFSSAYDWRDGIGPRGDRPTRLNLPWSAVESNAVGLDEMSRWADLVGADMMFTLNLGTGSLADACSLVEYANFPGGSLWSDLRLKHGRREPYGIHTWCLGNEVDGPWQIGHRSATAYAELAAQVAGALRLVDPTVEMIVSGSSKHAMPTFPSWDATVLERTWELVDYLGIHSYHWQYDDDLPSYLASSVDLEAFLAEAIATCDHVQAKLRSRKKMHIALDEWNVSFTDESWRREENYWKSAPPIAENRYTAIDAVVVGGLLNAILRHSDRVRVACLALLVNVSAPILTVPGGRAWRQPTYHPVAAVARHAGPVSVLPAVACPVMETGRYGDVPAIDAAATLDPETGRVVVFAVNRDVRGHVTTVRVPGEARAWVAEVESLEAAAQPGATNTVAEPERVRLRRKLGAEAVEGGARLLLPPLSWTVVRLQPRADLS